MALIDHPWPYNLTTLRTIYHRITWQDAADCYEFDLIQEAPAGSGHNAVDITMTVGAIDLLNAGIRSFCLATSDADFVALVQRLRRAGEHHGKRGSM